MMPSKSLPRTFRSENCSFRQPRIELWFGSFVSLIAHWCPIHLTKIQIENPEPISRVGVFRYCHVQVTPDRILHSIFVGVHE